jgi:PAS domain S-box-containing protein
MNDRLDLAALFDQLPLGVTAWDRELRNLYANAAAQRAFGRSGPTFRGTHLSEVIGAAAFEATHPMVERVLSGQAQQLWARVEGPEGPRNDNVRLLPLRDAAGAIMGCIALGLESGTQHTADTTRRALEISERRFRTLSDASPVGVFQTDAQGLCTYTNPRWQEIYGMSLAASLGEGWSRGVHPQDRASLLAHWRATASQGGEFALAFRVQHGDGSVRRVHARSRALLDDAGQVAGFVGTVEDVTESHLAQERLRELYERTPVMMHSIDTRGAILTVSDLWLEKMGYQRDEVIGQRGVNLFEASSQGARETELADLWASGRNVSRVHRVLRRDGSAMAIVASAIVQRDGAGRPLRALVVTDDVTELLARTAQLRQEQVQRAEVERQAAQLNALLAERSEMLDVLAHEVRQPLNNASAALQSAAAALADPTSRADAAERLQRAQGVMHAVLAGVDNTLAVAALLGRGAPPTLLDAEADIDTLLAVAIGDMPLAERTRVRIERAASTRTAAMDLGLTRLALRNLLANALRHSPPHAEVVLRVADSDQPLALVLEVIDRGPGIAQALQPRLFERGARGRERSGRASHGLGLYIVRRALELQGGRAELARSGPDGTTMRLWLAQANADKGARNT